MIIYDARKLAGYDVFLHHIGSALYSPHSVPMALISGGLGALFANVSRVTDWLQVHILQGSAYFGAVSFIVGFVVVYRAQIAFQRYAEAQSQYFSMASKLHDIVSFYNAFLLGDDKVTACLRNTILRWCRAYHELAIEEFQGIEFTMNDRTNLRKEEVELLARDRKRPIQISAWLLRLTMENRDRFKAGDAILSRVLQIITNTNLFYNQTRRIAETPFVFPIVQITSMMIHMWAFLTPLMIGSFFPMSNAIAAAVSGGSTWILFAVNESAAQLEQPFEPSSNNLPVAYYTIAFDDDVSAVKYMDFPDVFRQCREGDYHSMDTTETQEKGADIVPPGSVEKLRKEYNTVSDQSNAILKQNSDKEKRKRTLFKDLPKHHNFRFKSKLDAIFESSSRNLREQSAGPRDEEFGAEGASLRRSNSITAAEMRTQEPQLEKNTVDVRQTSSTSKLFDLFSLSRRDIMAEGRSESDHEDDEEETRGVIKTDDDVRLRVDEKNPAEKTIASPRRQHSQDDSMIMTHSRDHDDEIERMASDQLEKATDDNDIQRTALMYHTVHGAEAKKMAEELRLEREVQRRTVANRALILKLRLDQQRYDMRHHLRNVHAVQANVTGDYAVERARSHDESRGGSGWWATTTTRRTLKALPASWALKEQDHSSGGLESASSTSGNSTLRNRNKRNTVRIEDWPGWSTTNLTCARSRGIFEVFS